MDKEGLKKDLDKTRRKLELLEYIEKFTPHPQSIYVTFDIPCFKDRKHSINIHTSSEKGFKDTPIYWIRSILEQAIMEAREEIVEKMEEMLKDE